MPLPTLGYKHWEIFLYDFHDYGDATPWGNDAPAWDLLGEGTIRLVKPGRVALQTLFPEKLLVVARFKIDTVGGIGYLGFFIGAEVEPRLILETTSLVYVDLHGTLDIGDIFPRTSEVETETLYIKARPAGTPGTAWECAYHQVYYCVRR